METTTVRRMTTRLPPEVVDGRVVANRAPLVERPEYARFGQIVLHAMLKKGMNQSDLAKAIWGTVKDARGYEVAKNRDRITHYVKGRAYPEPENLAKLIEVLDLNPEDVQVSKLVRGAMRSSPPRMDALPVTKLAAETPPVTKLAAETLNISLLAAEPGKMLLQMQQILPTALVLLILKMVTDAKAAAETTETEEP